MTAEPVYQTPIPDYGRGRRSRFKRFAVIFIAIFVLYEVVKVRDRGPVTITVSDDGNVHVSKGKGAQWDSTVPELALKAARAYVKKNYPSNGSLKGSALIDPKHAVFLGKTGNGASSRTFHIYCHIPAKATHWEFDRIEFDTEDGADHDAHDS